MRPLWLRVVKGTAVLLVFVLLSGCGDRIENAAEVTVQNQPESRFVQVNGVRLHVMDWGGSGPVIMLIHGMGDSPRIFDDLARQLSPEFHVIAYARRGHGFSDPVGPFDTETLVEDLRQLMDRLGVQQAHLLGWSMGGNEITAFAGRYPDRTRRLVYLEAAYDWSDPAFMKAFAACPLPLAPDEQALHSLDAFRSWARRFWLPVDEWTPGLAAHLQEVTRIREDGTVQPVPDEKLTEQLMGALSENQRDYTTIHAPALALYSPVFFMTDGQDPDLEQAVVHWDKEMFEPFRHRNQMRIQQELSDVTIQTLPGTSHGTIGVKNPSDLADLIGTFLQKR